jgi:hypothetical protein
MLTYADVCFSQGEERCFVVEVLTPVAPFFVKPFKMNHTTAGIGGIASPSPDQAAKIATKIAVLQFRYSVYLLY